MGTAAPTYAEFIEQYPEFTDVPGPAVERQLSLSTRLLDGPAWGDFYSDGVGLDAAHNLLLSQQATAGGLQGGFQGAVGPVSSVSAAGVSTSFATPTPAGKHASADWYAKTVYGQQFLRLRNTVIPPAVMAC